MTADFEGAVVEAIYQMVRAVEKLSAQVEDTNRRLDSISVVLSELVETSRESRE